MSREKLYIIGALLAFAVVMWLFSGSNATTNYSIVIDAGSTGSRIHVYPYTIGNPLIQLHLGEDVSKKIRPGLSSFAETPRDSANQVDELLEIARENVPENQRSTTPIFLRATAGMRKVEAENPVAAKKVMETVRHSLEDSEFHFESDMATIITGIDEGLYGWVTSNYLNEYLQSHEEDASSSGVLEMGGESVQLTFIPNESTLKFLPKNKLRTLQIGDSEYQIFTHSWMGVGMEAAQARYDAINDGTDSPCYNPGLEHTSADKSKTFKGTGDYNKCVQAITPLAQASNCGDMDDILRCVFNGESIPKIEFEQFYFIENFYYTLASLGVNPNGADYMKDMAAKGKEFCSMSLEEVKTNYPKMEDWEVAKACFGAAWINVLLDVGFGLKDFTRFEVLREVNSGDIDWAMGYAIQYSSSNMLQSSMTTFFFVILVILAFVIFYMVQNRQSGKPQYQLVNQFPL